VNRARGSRYLAGAAALAAAGVVAAGCGSSGTGSSAASASASPRTGTQTLAGSVAGQAALANTSSIPLTLSGVVNTTATLSLSGSTRNPVMIKTGQGTLAVTHSAGTNSQKLLSARTCRFAFGNHSTYTVDGSRSTGTFKNATGSGTAVTTFTGNLPRKSDGSCNTSSSAVPQPSTARVSFVARGPLTVRK
jgi:hypothetical protein